VIPPPVIPPPGMFLWSKKRRLRIAGQDPPRKYQAKP
jgi:hypothetical protein